VSRDANESSLADKELSTGLDVEAGTQLI
jgi:hypothetical protein